MPVPVLEDSQRIYRSGLKALGGERLGNVRAPIESDMRVIMNKWRLLEDPQRIYPDVNGDFVFFNELQEVLVMLHNICFRNQCVWNQTGPSRIVFTPVGRYLSSVKTTRTMPQLTCIFVNC